MWPAAALSAAACVYYLLVLAAAWHWARAPRRRSRYQPPVSILKPVHGRDPRFFEAIRSHALQDYPEFEILFGVNDPNDPALDEIRRLLTDFPGVSMRVVVSPQRTPNGKVGVLADLAAQARYPVLVVNDSDILVDPGYLRSVVAHLADPGVGLVTCLYRAEAESPASRWEALGIATEFAPSVLVARMLGVVEFALGSTLALREEQLRAIGGFGPIARYLADDYQLGYRITRLGFRVAFAQTVVETDLGAEGWGDTWRHQLRWSRTIRVSRPAGYFGYVVTHATLWSLVAIAAGAWKIGAATLAVRMTAGVAVGAGILHDRKVARRFLLIPFRDLFGFGVWLAGLFGHTVIWRGQRLRLSGDGKITPQ